MTTSGGSRTASNDPFQGRVYNDSDVYKLLEAASYALAERSDDDLAATTNGVIDAIAGAQRPDGYVHSYFALEREHERYSDLTTQHELYCAGHLIQAGIAHRRATGSGSRLFDVARRFADHICDTFGPNAREGVDGHEEIELALADLYRETGRAQIPGPVDLLPGGPRAGAEPHARGPGRIRALLLPGPPARDRPDGGRRTRRPGNLPCNRHDGRSP